MTPLDIIEKVCSDLEGVAPKSSWGETSLFYNPGKVLPNGVYFCTIKEQNGENDKASDLDRDGVYRIAIGIGPQIYNQLFGSKPARPPKGGIISTKHDFTKTNELMPHPIYGWMSWVQILSPTQDCFNEIYPYIVNAHKIAIDKFTKNIATKSQKNQPNETNKKMPNKVAVADPYHAFLAKFYAHSNHQPLCQSSPSW